jgi:phosphatidylserine/phosphatidylglycerophosphate/cardiolipin synthase-like enzyme
VIIDKATLTTGSCNFSKAADESNAENLLILKGNKTRRTDTSRTLNRTKGMRRGMQEGDLNKNGC